MIYQPNKGLVSLRSPKGLGLFIMAGLFLGLWSGCGYRVGASPYQLTEPLAVNVLMAHNKSTNSGLAATLTNLVVEELATSPQITVIGSNGEEAGRSFSSASSVLQLTIVHWNMEGGAWEVENSYKTFSVSRRVCLTVEGLLTRKDAEGLSLPPIRRRVTTNRTYQVTNDQTQLETNQAYATDLALSEAARKLVLALFSDF